MFRKELVTWIDIDAAAEDVWKVLTDFGSYPQWNPMIRQASGKLEAGERLQVRFEPEGSRGYTFRPRLTVVDPGRELRWLGWPRFPGLIDTEHYWIMEEAPDGRTYLMHGSSVSGLFAPMVGPAMERSTRGPFEAMNQAHKERAEAGRKGVLPLSRGEGKTGAEKKV
ncbi:MAG: SRPBCC domain-containing protein [Actinomycetota bacterium]